MELKKRSAYELVIVTIVVGLALLLAIGLFSGRSKVHKGQILIQELSMLRSSIALFNMFNHRYPESLDELAVGKYESDGIKRPYIDYLHKSKKGHYVDPFGNPYSYDAKIGWVKSTTDKYKQW